MKELSGEGMVQYFTDVYIEKSVKLHEGASESSWEVCVTFSLDVYFIICICVST